MKTRQELIHAGAKRSEQARANMRAGWAKKKLEQTTKDQS